MSIIGVFGYCTDCRGPCKAPLWVSDISRWHRPVTSESERRAAREFLANNPRLAALTERIRAKMGGAK